MALRQIARSFLRSLPRAALQQQLSFCVEVFSACRPRVSSKRGHKACRADTDSLSCAKLSRESWRDMVCLASGRLPPTRAAGPARVKSVRTFCWEYPLSCRPLGTRRWRARESPHVLQVMLMAYPNQAGSLQGSCSVGSSILVVDDPGNGSGWQQSKQNWTLPTVVGK